MPKTWYLYILLCDQKMFYVGITTDIINRTKQHKSKNSFFTKKFSDLKLVYCEKYLSEHKAVLREKQIKKWNKTKKQMLIEGKLGYNTCTEMLDKYAILIDSIPPTISNFIAPLNKKPTKEAVVVDIGNWQGYLDSVNSVAITGSIQGNIKNLTIDGKAVSWDESNKIYQRMNLFIYGGLNKYKVVAEDMAGNISTGYVQTTAERDSDELNINLND